MKILLLGILFLLLFIGALMVGTGVALMIILGFIGQGLAWLLNCFTTYSGLDAWGERLLIKQGIA